MKRSLVAALVLLVCAGTSAFAELDETRGADQAKNRFGAGMVLGYYPYVGGTAKFFFTPNLAVDATLGIEYILYVDANCTYNLEFFKIPKGKIVWGFGGGVLLDAGPWGADFGVHADVGAEWFMPWAPVGVFINLKPGVAFGYYSPHFIMGSVVGVRYYF